MMTLGADTKIWALTDLDYGELCIFKIMHQVSSIGEKLVKNLS